MKFNKLQRKISLFTAGAIIFSAALFGACKKDPEADFTLEEGTVNLSAEGGIYTEGFTLYAYPYSSGNKIYYTTDGSEPTINSTRYTAGGIEISDVSTTADYSLTDAVKADRGYGEYEYEHIMAGVPYRFIEVDSSGNTVAKRTVTYVVTEENYYTRLSAHPVIFLTADEDDWMGEDGIYSNQWDDSLSIRAEMEYYDKELSESYFVNTKVTVGGKWTRGYPQHTLNLNFKKDENGENNVNENISFFGDRERRDGNGTLSGVMRMRLHNGGNAWTTAFFSDAFVQTVAKDLDVSTTAYRPCSVFLNGEYWGTYAMREKYSRDYFEQNYGVDKDNVIYADRYYGNPSSKLVNSTLYTTYGFSLDAEDEERAYKLLNELFDFIKNNDFTDEAVYEKFSEMVDVDSLLDCILVNGYVCNWDFFNNNLRMWRSVEVDESNPYADGRWRFCLHDTDFSFNESSEANSGLSERARRSCKNYFDFYAGNAEMSYSNVGTLPYNTHCLLSEPLKSDLFKARMAERAEAVEEAFDYDRASEILSEMKDDIKSILKLNIKRWGAKYYTTGTWENCVQTIDDNMYYRSYYFYKELKSAYGLKFS